MFFSLFLEKIWEMNSDFSVGIISVDAELLIRILAMRELNNDRTFN